ncbi:NAD(P)-dependent dehydrogenase (short-subunit alcohol dehydrogenase family) [Streptomyces sp. Amel2xB2]|nr:NAD(P)-dependent dehydrogenase (short-subunit alcohol dehydrogenase family) [Streptomyces sp. Amel2xB2]
MSSFGASVRRVVRAPYGPDAKGRTNGEYDTSAGGQGRAGRGRDAGIGPGDGRGAGRRGRDRVCDGADHTGARQRGRPASETIEGTAELIAEAGGTGVAVPADHLEPEQARGVVERIDREQGRLDVLVNDIWGGDHLVKWDRKMWEHDLEKGLRILRLGVESHIVTSRYAIPLLVRRPGGLVVEVTDGTEEFNGQHYRGPFSCDLAKYAPLRMARALAEELPEHGATAVCLTPGWLRSEAMLDTHFEVTEENWRAGATAPHGTRTSRSPSRPSWSGLPWRRSPPTRTWPGSGGTTRAGGSGGGCSLSSGGLAREYGFTDADGSAPDAWRYIAEVQEAGRPADVTGYR